MIKEFENFAAVSGGEVVAGIETKEECINSCLLKVIFCSISVFFATQGGPLDQCAVILYFRLYTFFSSYFSLLHFIDIFLVRRELPPVLGSGHY